MKTRNRKRSVSRRDFLKTGAAAGAGASALMHLSAGEAAGQPAWDRTADFVTIGAGTAGLAAAISAREHGASVTMVEENTDIGGHGLVSGGLVHLGGGHSYQQKAGVNDSADQVFLDWVRWDHRQSRYSDRDLVRVFADENAPTFEWLLENGVQFQPNMRGPGEASTVRRQVRAVQWPIASERVTHEPGRDGSGVVRALAKSARAKGVEILLQHKMTTIVREQPLSGRVLGITAVHAGRTMRIAARRGVLVATGGSSSNVNLRRVFDPRLTEEYQVAGEPWSRQSGDGELAAMAIGASLWATANYTVEEGDAITKTFHVGARWGYRSLIWRPTSPIFDRVRGTGLTVTDWQDAVLVNRRGLRFYNEADDGYEFYAAALAYSGDRPHRNGGGPIWAIFDEDAVEREGWEPAPPNIDPDGYFFKADTLAELARAIRNPYQGEPMPGSALEATITRYNSFVSKGVDEDFKKPTPLYAIQRPPFYAAWATPILHDSLTGLRTNTNAQVIDINGEVIPGLYCAGESQGGFAQHGLARCLVFGRIAGRHAALNGLRT
jgi:hypothetical protein